MSVVKIFLPKYLFYNKKECEIFGEIQITEKSISYFVISDENRNELRHLGYVVPAGKKINKDVSMIFSHDSIHSSIYLTKLSIKTSNATVPNIFLYDAHKIVQLHYSEKKKCKYDKDSGDTRMLYDLLVSFQKKPTKTANRQAILAMLISFVWECIHRSFSIVEYRPIFWGFKKLVLYEQYIKWKTIKATRKRTANIVLDKLIGVVVMITLLLFITKPGDDLIQVSHYVIHQLRQLLGALKGNPIGLKLNDHLNNFFLDCFTYHIDLWATFLDLIEPIVRQLFVPMALVGLMGFSFQLAMLADLIGLVGLHAHSFYIYTAVLYKVEIKGLQVLWKVVLGKRRNPLKNRVEAHEYMNRQLYLATMFFASLVFLLPTILVYYTVFTTLRLAIYLVTILIKTIQRTIIEFPLQTLIKWSLGRFYEIDSLHLQHLNMTLHQNFMKMSVFEINVKSSSLSRVFACEAGFLKENKPNENITLKSILLKIIQGSF
ncbi:uncharacterized protein LOC129908735 [Episyrphus balteatus]|uniref:uncharacterized protein LOC129908735 n=1 Tax=Episyrphus balteatus TaxID=286459 RepID=UPI002485685F|nr:uncharacterized protein LOC129908735 [Episyrphus balteatus]